jgi:hypothetical protein
MEGGIWPFLKAGLIAAGAFVAMLLVANLPFLCVDCSRILVRTRPNWARFCKQTGD